MMSATVKIGAGDPHAVVEAPLDVAEPAGGELGQLRVEPGGGLARVEHPDQVEAHQGRPDGADRGEAPLDDAGAAGTSLGISLPAFSAR
jgi:hypothetical protein